jgi:aminoglycoside 3-N-acetyltransferase
MSEHELIRKTKTPQTRDMLAVDLARLGVRRGGVLLVHSSLSSLGWVIGGARAVIEALRAAQGKDGTLVMPAFSADNNDPAGWENPPVPKTWHDVIRNNLPGFDPARTPTVGMGRIAEQFRTWPGARRSGHPTVSLAALGPNAMHITRHQPLEFGLGEDGPLGRLYELDAQVLLLGTGHDSNSSLHLAEARAAHGRRQKCSIPVTENGTVIWRTFEDAADDDDGFFPRIGADFEATDRVAVGPVGKAKARLMPQRALVDFAQTWLDRKLG